MKVSEDMRRARAVPVSGERLSLMTTHPSHVMQSAAPVSLKSGELRSMAEEIIASRAALSALPPDGEAVAAQCCVCGKSGLSTVEGDGGTECQLSDGRWTCSQDCYYTVLDWFSPTSPGNADRSEGTDWAYLAAVLEAHADKFPVPSHIRTYAAALRSSPPQPEEGDKRVVVGRPANFAGWKDQLAKLEAIVHELARDVSPNGPEDRAWAIIEEMREGFEDVSETDAILALRNKP